MRNLERAVDLDPRNALRCSRLRSVTNCFGAIAEEKSVLDRALAIVPNDVTFKVEPATVEFYWKADTRPLHQVIDSIRATNPATMRRVSRTTGFFAHWPNAMPLPQKMP